MMVPLKDILLSARLCKIAYLEPHDDEVSHVFSELGQRGKLVYFDGSRVKADTQAFVWWNAEEKKVYVFFRGTDSKRDMLANLDVRSWKIKEHGRNVCVHRGFQEQFLAVKDDVKLFLEEHKGRFDHVVFLRT